MNNLPIELLDNVLWQMADTLWWRREALKACSLVCRHWLPLSQQHLFRSMGIRVAAPTTDISIPEHSLCHQAPGVRRVDEVLRFFRDHQHFAGWVKDLTLRAEDEWLQAEIYPLYPWDVLREMLSCLPQLSELRVVDIIVRAPNFTMQPISYLKTLIIEMPHSVDEDGILDILSLFGSVDTLEIENVEYDPSDVITDDPKTLHFPIRIQPQALNMRLVSSIKPFLDALRASGATRCLRTVTFERIENLEELIAVSDVLAESSPNITNLDIDVSWAIWKEDVDLASMLHLDKSRSLQSLVLFTTSHPDRDDVDILGGAEVFLRRIATLFQECVQSAVPLRDIAIYSDDLIGNQSVMDGVEDSRVEANLDRLESLRTVSVYCPLLYFNEAPLFPRLRAKGVGVNVGF